MTHVKSEMFHILLVIKFIYVLNGCVCFVRLDFVLVPFNYRGSCCLPAAPLGWKTGNMIHVAINMTINGGLYSVRVRAC